MALSSGFFDSISQDRVYNAEQFGAIFDGLIKDGVFATIGNHFLVAQTTPAAMQVRVQRGKAWFNHTWIVNDGDVVLSIPIAHTVNPRIDSIVLEVNRTVEYRTARLIVLSGDPAVWPVAPTLTNSENVHQYRLANIQIPANSTVVTGGFITNRIGTTECPYVTGIMETVEADELYAQWASAFAELLSSCSNTFNTWFNSLEPVFSETEYQNIMLRVASVANIRTGTFAANSWTETSSGSGIFTQTITISGMSADYNPILVGVIPSDATVTSAQTYNKEFSKLVQGRGTTATNSVTWYCYGGKPNTDLTVGFKGE